jgi:mRNA interferase RelE/StbE
VNLQIVHEEKAINADDPGGLGEVMDAVDALADDPRPAASFPYGSPDLRPLRIGRYRIATRSR